MKKEHRRKRFGEVIKTLITDRYFRSERELARRFGRSTNSTIRHWQDGKSSPEIEDYEILAHILKIFSVDALLEFLDSNRDIKDFLKSDEKDRSPAAKTASGILRVCDGLEEIKKELRAIAFSIDPTQINYTSADNSPEYNVTTYAFDNRQKKRLAALLRDSAQQYRMDVDAIIERVDFPSFLAQELLVFSSLGGEHFVAENYLERLLPYLYQVAHWEGDRPILKVPFRQYDSVASLINALKGNGASCGKLT